MRRHARGAVETELVLVARRHRRRAAWNGRHRVGRHGALHEEVALLVGTHGHASQVLKTIGGELIRIYFS